MQIFWLKRNLRLQDSEPFFMAMKGYKRFGRVLPLYCHEPSLITQPDVSRQHQLFVHETLNELSAELNSNGGQLLEVIGETIEVLRRIHSQQNITRIWTHRETTQQSQFQRDNHVRDWCRKNGVQLIEVAQNGIARGQQPQTTFPDYFSDSVNRELKDPRGVDLSKRFAELPFPSCSRSDVPAAHGVDKPLRQKGGRRAAEKALRTFFTSTGIMRYPYSISSPNTAWEGCSRISTYLAYGIVSDREVFRAVDQAVTSAHQFFKGADFESFQRDARFYLDRLGWRRQYMQTFEHHPRLEFECMLPQFEGVRESEYTRLSEEHFERWKAGQTGYPYIDAAMRFLNQSGWLNMRLRATVVSFATMNLWIPTQRVAEYLAQEFLDYEPAIHHVIHQLIAGTTNFQGLMVYDPVKQGLDHDAKAIFIKQWVPELRELSASEIHNIQAVGGSLSKEASAGGMSPYPSPIVDHKATGKLAKTRIHVLQKGLKANDEDLKHDSDNDRLTTVQTELF